MKKKFFSVILIFILCLTISIPAFAYEYDAYVIDNADLLSTNEEALLYKLAMTYAKELNMDVVFLTYVDANGKDTMTYTDDFYDGLIGGTCYADDGILFAIDMDNREIYINTVGLAIRELTDDEIEAFLDAGFAKISRGNYYECLEIMAKRALKNIQDGVLGHESSEELNNVSFLEQSKELLPISGILGFIVMLVLLFIHNSANQKPLSTHYMDKLTFRVNNRNPMYTGTKKDVIRGYYRQNNSSSSSSRSSGGSSHRSSSGRSHGGGGRKF